LRIERTIFWRDEGEKMGRMLIRGRRRGRAYLYILLAGREKNREIELFALVGVLDPQPVYGNCWFANVDPQLNRVTLITGLVTIT
jgi:hypothetical protein